MFIGHYAPALAAKAVRNSPSLVVCFLAVHLVDIGFFSLAYFGVEKWRPSRAIEGIMPVDLYFLPYTHSLLASAVWALVAGAVSDWPATGGRHRASREGLAGRSPAGRGPRHLVRSWFAL